LSEGNKWQFFPSVAIAWQVGEEWIVKIKNFKLGLKFEIKASYGESG